MSGVRASLPAPKNIMYKIYYTDPKAPFPLAFETQHLEHALKYCETLRRDGMQYVTLVSDYANMVGKPGASGTDSSYVPQMLNA